MEELQVSSLVLDKDSLCLQQRKSNSSLAVGIDLGTTFSVVGINKNGRVIIVEDKDGHRIFPSIVSYKGNGGRKIYTRNIE